MFTSVAICEACVLIKDNDAKLNGILKIYISDGHRTDPGRTSDGDRTEMGWRSDGNISSLFT